MEDDADSWLATGYAHYAAGNWNDAGDAIERSLALAPDCAEAWYRLGNVRQEQGRHPSAAACFERAAALDPAHARAWNNLGISRQALGHDQAAVDAYRRAVERDPSLAIAHLNLGHLLSERGEHGAAARCFERAAALDPGNVDLWLRTASARRRAGLHAQAQEACRRAIAANPALAKPYLELAAMASARGDHGEAERWYRAGLAHCPGDPVMRHMLDAVRGDTSARPPEGYVAALFDAMAHAFDRHLVQDLEYRVPEALARLVIPALRKGSRSALDLGCGTGMLGAALAGSGLSLTGVDLSGAMLREAERRGGYARLVQGDLLEQLQLAHAGALDAVLAADCFIYLGKLDDVFAATARALAPGGLFAFSLEHCDGAGYRLMPSGRYAHSLAYVQALAAETGLTERQAVAAPLRREGGAYAQGWLVILEQPPSPRGAPATGCS